MLKKKITVLIAALICGLIFLGCSEAVVKTSVTIFSDGSGIKEISVRVWGDSEPIPGKDHTAGNNTAFMLIKGDELKEKLYEFCNLDSAVINVTNATSKQSAYITLKYEFSDINDYNAKSKILAGKYAEKFEDALMSEIDGVICFKESVHNSKIILMDMLEKYFEDFDCYPVYEYGPETSNQFIPNGIKFDDGVIDGGTGTMESFTHWFKVAEVSVKVGDEIVKVSPFNETNFTDNKNYENYIEINGIPGDAEDDEDDDEDDEDDDDNENNEDINNGNGNGVTGCSGGAEIVFLMALAIGAYKLIFRVKGLI